MQYMDGLLDPAWKRRLLGETVSRGFGVGVVLTEAMVWDMYLMYLKLLGEGLKAPDFGGATELTSYGKGTPSKDTISLMTVIAGRTGHTWNSVSMFVETMYILYKMGILDLAHFNPTGANERNKEAEEVLPGSTKGIGLGSITSDLSKMLKPVAFIVGGIVILNLVRLIPLKRYT